MRSLTAIGGALLLLVWTAVLRAPAIMIPVLDWDEGLYLTVAQQWARGDLPYVAVWDHKPIGVYVLFRFAIAVFGHSVAASRLLGVLAVWLSALTLGAVARRLYRSPEAGLIASIVYPAWSLAFFGVSINTETFFVAFDLLGVWLLIRAWDAAPSARSFLIGAAGLAFGLALQVKYLAAIEIAFFVAAFSLASWRHAASRKLQATGQKPEGRSQELLRSALIFSALLVLPSAATAVYFWSHGVWAALWEANVTANLRHVGVLTPADRWRAFEESIARWLFWTAPAWLGLAIFGSRTSQWPAFNRGNQAVTIDRLLVAWIVVGWIEALLTRQQYVHYFQVTVPPVCLLASRIGATVGTRHLGRATGIGLALAVPTVLAIVIRVYLPWTSAAERALQQEPVQIAEALRARLEPDDHVYVVSGPANIYFLAGASPATKYALPLFLLHPHFSAVANINPLSEVDRIFLTPPACVVVDASDPRPPVRHALRYIEAEYERVQTIGLNEVRCRVRRRPAMSF